MKEPYKDNLQGEDTSIDVNEAWKQFADRHKDEPASPVWGPLDPIGRSPFQPAVAGEMRQPARKSAAKKVRFRASRWRGTAAAAIAVLLIVGGFATPAGDKVFAAMLDTFRIQHFTAVEITADDMSKIQEALQNGTLDAQSFDLQQYGEVEVTGGGQGQKMSAEEASRQLGGDVKTLSADGGEELYVHPSISVTLKLNVDSVNRMLGRLGGKTKFPADADGQPVTVSVPGYVESSLYGASASASGADEGAYKQLSQMKMPKLDVPAGIDVDQVRRAILDLPLLTDDLRSKLEAIEDWRNTIPVPVAEGKGKEAVVAGSEAVISGDEGYRVIVWTDGEWIYSLSGSAEAYPADEDLIKEANRIAAQ